jgi:TonB family protein
MIAIGKLARCVVIASVGFVTLSGDARARGNADGTATEELRNLMAEALAAARAGGHTKLEEIAHGLMIPRYEAWLNETFEEKGATKAVETYRNNLDYHQRWLPTYFEFLSKQEGEVFVEPLRLPTSPVDGIWCGDVLLVPIKSNVLYRVLWQQAHKGGKRELSNVGYFAFVQGAYRRLACETPWHEPNSPGPPLPRGKLVRVGGNVQAARILYRIAPKYPEEAVRARISGVVRLHVVLTEDGTVQEIEVVSGHPLFLEAAMDAVQRWIYSPTFLNNEPVQVDTTVDLVFALSNRPGEKAN